MNLNESLGSFAHSQGFWVHTDPEMCLDDVSRSLSPLWSLKCPCIPCQASQSSKGSLPGHTEQTCPKESHLLPGKYHLLCSFHIWCLYNYYCYHLQVYECVSLLVTFISLHFLLFYYFVGKTFECCPFISGQYLIFQIIITFVSLAAYHILYTLKNTYPALYINQSFYF